MPVSVACIVSGQQHPQIAATGVRTLWRRALGFEKDHADALARQTAQVADISGGQTEREEVRELTKSLGGNSGTPIERIRSFHVSSLAPS
jgi:hypothetical protein